MIARLFEHPLSLAIVIVLVIVLLGWKRLPDAARSMGRSARILRSEADELKRESEERRVARGESKIEAEKSPDKAE